jgi:hypothetical protein
MAWVQADLDNIEKAIATGTRRVQLNGRSHEYQSMESMIAARDAIKADLNSQAIAAGGVRRPAGYRARTGKGL